MSMYHFSDAEAVEHDVNTVPAFGDFERVEIDGQWYVPERTCEQRRTRCACRYVRDHMGVAGNWFSKCSECGAEFDERVVDSHFVYCPNCGARVVDDD